MPVLDQVVTQLKGRLPAYRWAPTDGCSGVSTFRLSGPDPLYAKFAAKSERTDPPFDAAAEAARIDWLASVGFPGPKLLDAGETDGIGWLVMTAVPGRSAAEDWPSNQRDAVIDAVAEILVDLHALPVDDCPFGHSGGADDAVVHHGDFCLPNVMIDPMTLTPTGLVDLGQLGRGDRSSDLMDMTHSIESDSLNPQYGTEHADRFLMEYHRRSP